MISYMSATEMWHYNSWRTGMYKLASVEHLLDGKPYYAHTDKRGYKDKEPLIAHMKLTIKYFNDYSNKKGLMPLINSLIKESGFDEKNYKIVLDMFANAVYLHDIGKINPDFQRAKMGNNHFKPLGLSTAHSIFSSYIYISEILKMYPQIDRKCFMALLSFAYIISCHHGRLTSAIHFEDSLLACFDNGFYDYDIYEILDSPRNIGLGSLKMKKLFDESQGSAFFILLRLLFSLITASDFCATTEYMNETKHEISIIEDFNTFCRNYYGSSLVKSIRNYKSKGEVNKINHINDLRTEIFLEAEKTMVNNLDDKLFYLEAPTGSGKTNTSINLALKLLENDRTLNNIFYIFPFNTLVEQTANCLGEYFSKDELAIVNSITPINKNNDEEIDYNSLWLNRLFNNYRMVVTTHVNFFDALFGTSKEQVFPLIKLCNSVIIIDEIQSYKNRIWPEIIIFLSKYAELLNMKIVIMSATLPRIDKAFQVDSRFVELLKDSRKYYEHPFFRDRVIIDESLMKEDSIDLDFLAEHVLNNKNKNVLVEFITKVGARDFFNIINAKIEANEEYRSFRVYELSGDDCSLVRKDVISQTKNSCPVILIATQVIEAGIDIDMDIGYKEISLPDSEEQFMGRINRSCQKSRSTVYFFNYTNPELIYKGDCRVNYTINNEIILEYLKNKNFLKIYEHILNDLKLKRDQKNYLNIKGSISLCQTLEFEKIKKLMQLIKPSLQIFIPYIFVAECGKEINGYAIWEEYKCACESSYEYAKKKVCLSAIKAKMDPFIFNITNLDDAIGLNLEEFGGIYFVEDGEQFIDNGKFDRKAFNSHYRGRFL